MDETMNASVESTTSEQAETQQDLSTENETATVPQEQLGTEDNTASDGESMGAATEQQADEPYMIARFNHEDKPLSREEATNWVQLGMKHQALYDKLDYIAAQSDSTVDSLIDNMVKSMEEAKISELKERFGDDESVINDLMTLWHNGQKEKYEKVVNDRKSAAEQQAQQSEQNLNERLASEFTAMKKDFPELTDFASLPADVKKAAADGMPLAYAYLMHNHTESRKTAEAAQAASAAANKSTGSMATDTAAQLPDPFIAGVFGS